MSKRMVEAKKKVEKNKMYKTKEAIEILKQLKKNQI